MAQTLMTISNILLILAVVSLAASVFVFLRLDIRGVIAELTGKSARKSIEQLREDNKKSGVRRFRVLDRSGTDQVSVIKEKKESGSTPGTEPLPGETAQQTKNRKMPTEPLKSEKENDYQETTGLEDGKDEYLETSYMESSETAVSTEGAKATDSYVDTTLLQSDDAEYGETSVMEEELKDASAVEGTGKGGTVPLGDQTLQLLQDIVLIHTDEVIPL